MKRTVAAIIGVYLLACAGIGAARAGGKSEWSHYRDRRTGNVVVIKSRCVAAEDSAAHIRLADYRDAGGHIVLGCGKRGY